MTPKEKAQELFNKMFSPPNCVISLHRQAGRTFLAKQCALIAVDEIIEANPIKFDEDDNCIASYWWKEVKQEIEKL
jgi:hypothetical protein